MNIPIPREIIRKLRAVLLGWRQALAEAECELGIQRQARASAEAARDRLQAEAKDLRARLQKFVFAETQLLEFCEEAGDREFRVRVSRHVMRCAKDDEDRRKILEEALKQCVESNFRAARKERQTHA